MLTRLTCRRQRLHHEAGSNREGPYCDTANPQPEGLRQRSHCQSDVAAVHQRLANEAISPIAELSDRELEVFRLIGEGHSTRMIADELHLSVKTVESYPAHIKDKLR